MSEDCIDAVGGIIGEWPGMLNFRPMGKEGKCKHKNESHKIKNKLSTVCRF